jgi:phage tail tube protein FII
MSTIKYVDTDGAKGALLPKATFGYDDYDAGGDAGRVWIGTGVENLALARKDEVDTVTADSDNLKEITGTTVDTRYDKLLAVRDVIDMEYVGGDLSTVRYEGDDDATVYYRDVMTYDVDGNMTQVDHFYDTADLVTASGQTVLTYVSGDLTTATYSE